jgi:hypothetical protein
MNRRHFLAGSVALASQHNLLRSMSALPDAAALVAPHNLLSSTYTEAMLESKLAAFGAWHPYPKCDERSAWLAVPEDLRTAVIARAEDDLKAGWKAILAVRFLDFRRNGNRSRYEADSFGRRAMLQRLILAECFEGKGRFTDEIANGVWLICEESFWGAPAHMAAQKAGVGLPDVTEPIIELFSAETAQLLAWTNYLLGAQLEQVSPLINQRIRVETERRMLKPARERNDFTWMGLGGPKQEHRLNNWCPWINSNLLVTNLLLEEDPKLRVAEAIRITRSVDTYINDFWADAAEEEGPGYFSRSVMCLFEVIDALESATGRSTNIFANPFLDAMGRFILNVHIAHDDYVDYGDVHGKAAPSGDILYRFGKAVHDEQLMAFGAYYAAKDGWNAQGEGLKRAMEVKLISLTRSLPAVLNASEVRAARQEDVLVRDAWYPEFGLMTARERAGSTDGMYVAVLASNNGRSHSHNDTGNFVIYQDGEPVAIDVGVETYTAKTFSPERYTIWTMQSAFHNLPTVGGVMQHNGVDFEATARKYSTSDERATVSFDLTKAYPKEAGIKTWVRTVTLERKTNRVEIEDAFELERAEPITLTVMTPRIPTAAAGAVTLKLVSGTGADAKLSFDDAQLTAKVEKIEITDPSLREDWGEAIHRVLLNTRQPLLKGKLVYSFARA